MTEYNPWESGCLGCAQEAMIKERIFELIKKEAEAYAKKEQIDVTIYMEAGVWKYLSSTIAAKIGIHHGREIIYFSKLTSP